MDPEFLVGYGADDHRIKKGAVAGKPLVLAGIVISKEYSTLSHSDGDVVYHSLTNALLLALGERDIGYHFPDNSKEFLNAESDSFVKVALEKMKRAGYQIQNLTVMITAGEPKIGPHVDSMKMSIAMLLSIDKKYIGIGATTGEKPSEYGKGKGINSVTTILLRKK